MEENQCDETQFILKYGPLNFFEIMGFPLFLFFVYVIINFVVRGGDLTENPLGTLVIFGLTIFFGLCCWLNIHLLRREFHFLVDQEKGTLLIDIGRLKLKEIAIRDISYAFGTSIKIKRRRTYFLCLSISPVVWGTFNNKSPKKMAKLEKSNVPITLEISMSSHSKKDQECLIEYINLSIEKMKQESEI